MRLHLLAAVAAGLACVAPAARTDLDAGRTDQARSRANALFREVEAPR